MFESFISKKHWRFYLIAFILISICSVFSFAQISYSQTAGDCDEKITQAKGNTIWDLRDDIDNFLNAVNTKYPNCFQWNSNLSSTWETITEYCNISANDIGSGLDSDCFNKVKKFWQDLELNTKSQCKTNQPASDSIKIIEEALSSTYSSLSAHFPADQALALERNICKIQYSGENISLSDATKNELLGLCKCKDLIKTCYNPNDNASYKDYQKLEDFCGDQSKINNELEGQTLLNGVKSYCAQTYSGAAAETIPITYPQECYDKLNLENALRTASPATALNPNIRNCYGSGYSIIGWLTSPFDAILALSLGAIALLIKFILGIVIAAFIWALNPINWQGALAQPGATPPGFVHNPVVQGAWPFVRDFANIGIILALLYIAIAVILRLKGYEAKNLLGVLGKLAIVALLVNFSLVICGIFVDLSNYLIIYFLNLSNTTNLGQTIGNTIDNIACAFGANADEFKLSTSRFAALLFGIIFLGQFIGLLVYAVIRVLTIWVCLILSPLAFVSSIIPQTKVVWEQWRNQFTKALINMPILAFSLWFILALINGISQTLIQQAQSGALSLGNLLAYGAVLVILAQALLMIANIIGAKEVNTGYSKATKWVTGLLTGGAVLAGRKALTGISKSEKMGKITKTLTSERMPTLIRKMGLGLERIRSGAKAKEEEQIDKWMKEIKDNNEMLHAAFSVHRDYLRRLKVLNQLVANGEDLKEEERSYYEGTLRQRYEGTPEARKIEKAIPSLKLPPAGVPLAQYTQYLAQVIAPQIYSNLADAKERLTLSFIEDLDIKGEWGNFIKEFLKNIKDVRQLYNFISSVPESQRLNVVQKIEGPRGLGASVADYLASPPIPARPGGPARPHGLNNNPDLYDQIITSQDSRLISPIQLIRNIFRI